MMKYIVGFLFFLWSAFIFGFFGYYMYDRKQPILGVHFPSRLLRMIGLIGQKEKVSILVLFYQITYVLFTIFIISTFFIKPSMMGDFVQLYQFIGALHMIILAAFYLIIAYFLNR